MNAYLDLLRYVSEHGEIKASRAITQSNQKKPNTKSIFGYQYRVSLADGFPLLTTKKLNFRNIAVELLWFLSGSTNVAPLRNEGVKIWDQWANEDGELGPIYGKQWRRWEAPDGRKIDQIEEVLTGIRMVMADPQASEARRLVVSAWNPADQYGPSVVYSPLACHTLFQFMVAGEKLSCHLYQRSADLFLGVPWNIASYALLTHLIAKVVGLTPGDFIHSFGDAHIYENHFDQITKQLSREPLALPTLILDDSISSLDGLAPEQMHLVGYNPHPGISGEVAV